MRSNDSMSASYCSYWQDCACCCLFTHPSTHPFVNPLNHLLPQYTVCVFLAGLVQTGVTSFMYGPVLQHDFVLFTAYSLAGLLMLSSVIRQRTSVGIHMCVFLCRQDEHVRWRLY